MLRLLFTTLLCVAFAINTHALDINVSEASAIQNAINQVSASGGGTVQLAAGTYVISASIKMKSNVTLQGVGTTTRIELPTTATYPMIIDDGTEPCINMTVRNMLLDGNIPESKVSHDPDYTSDPQNGCLGIFFDASTEATYHTNVIIENVEIHNTVDACHLKGVRGGHIDNVYFHHNGIFFWPGHNAYLRRCIDYSVTNSRFEESYNGSGVNCSWSKNLLFSHCEVIKSEGRGIRNAASEGFVVHDCIIVDCGADGIIANTEGGISTSNVDFRNNCVSGCNVGLSGGTSGVVSDNNAFNNSTNYSLGSNITQLRNISEASQSCVGEIVAWNEISISALVDAENTKNIILNVSHAIAANAAIDGFSVELDGKLANIGSVDLLNPTTLVISLTDAITQDNIVTLSYAETGNVLTEQGKALVAFEDISVDNSAGLAMEIEKATVDVNGLFVTLKLNTEIATIHNQADNFTFKINDKTIAAARTVVLDRSLQVYPLTKIYLGDAVELTYAPGDYARVVATNKSELKAFSNLSLENISTLTLFVIPGKIEAENYDAQKGVQLENCDEGGQNLAYINTGDWVEYNVQVDKDTTYKASFRSAAPADGGEITVFVDGKQKGVATVPNTGGWQKYQLSSVDINLASGAHSIKLYFTGGFNLNWMSFEETLPKIEEEVYDRLEAEDFDAKNGTSIENCSDIGGGENIGSVRDGHWLMFSDVDLNNVIGIDMRLATSKTGSSVEVRLGSTSGALIATIDFPNTGGFQAWETASADLKDVDGRHDVYFVFKSSGSWVGNINWIQFHYSTKPAALSQLGISDIALYPNPMSDELTITNAIKSTVQLFNVDGLLLRTYRITDIRQSFDVSHLEAGIYMVRILSDNASAQTFKVMKH